MDPKNESTTSLKPNYKLWLEYNGEYVFGPGAYSILKSIEKTGSITNGAKMLSMSYRYVWGVIRKIEKKLGIKILNSYKGGTVGGGGAIVTEFGLKLIKMYAQIQRDFENAVKGSNQQSL